MPTLRSHRLALACFLTVVSLILLYPRSVAAEEGMQVVAVAPAARSLTAALNASIIVEFDRPVAPDSVNSDNFWGFGKWSGTIHGTYSFSNGNRTVTLTPATRLLPGEQVMVILGTSILGADNMSLRAGGYSYQFWTASAPSTLSYETIDVFSTRSSPTEATRAYGGGATDLNNDGWSDLIVINEDSADVRIFLNAADGSGRFTGVLTPTSPVNIQASPSEPSDFNRDGNADLVVANISTNSLSVLLGKGDGAFAPQQEIDVGSAALPRGVVVLDVEGDGDMDIVSTNAFGGGNGNLAVVLNDGTGVFGKATFFEGGDEAEWGLVAADMNEDGRLDLAVGSQHTESPEILILTANGDGTFTQSDTTPAGGVVWMLSAGDMNGDGHEDILSANSVDDNGAVLLGDGTGRVGQPTTVASNPFPLSTDVADMDGDGDLDWAISSYFGNLSLYANQGNGTFVLDQEFAPSESSSCAIMFDVDNDGDLDLALIDETADEVTVLRNTTQPTAITFSDALLQQSAPQTEWMWFSVPVLVLGATVGAIASRRRPSVPA